MSALGRVVRSGVLRRKVQTLVIGLSVTIAVTSSVLGGALLVASAAPFADSFTAQNGAHLSTQFDATKASAAALTTTVAGVTASAGPFPTASLTAKVAGRTPPPLTVVGRADPGGPVESLSLLEGRWATGPGEIVVSADLPERLGGQMSFAELPGSPLTVVGRARSITRTADAWVLPSVLGTPHAYQMLYRFAAAETTAQMETDRTAVAAAVPGLTGAQSWLSVKQTAERQAALFVPFLVAFGVLGLVMSVLIVGNVVAGAVASGRRRIGILKALGCTPGQVVWTYVAQAVVPASIGTAAGVVAGHLLVGPVLEDTEEAYGTTSLGVSPWVDVVVVAGMLGVVALTAWASAWRAGRLRTVDALAVGRTPGPGRGRWATRLTARLPLPRPVGLGLARPFARPAQALAMVAAIVFGATAVTFAFGLASSLNEVLVARSHNVADITIGATGPQMRQQSTMDPKAITAAITAQSGTRAYYSLSRAEVSIAGVSGTTDLTTFTGDGSWGGYEMTAGRWFSGPGEAVVPTTFLTAAGVKLGDSVTLNDHGRSVPVKIVGEVFDTSNDGMTLLTDAATFPAQLRSYHIAVKSGTDVNSYVDGLNTALRSTGFTAQVGASENSGDTIALLDGLTAVLTLMLVAVAGLGVLNGVVLETRDRVHDLGVYKALGLTPRQTVAMVVASVLLTGLLGGAVGVPLGMALHELIVPTMGSGAGVVLPASVLSVFDPAELALLGLGGLAIAILGALLPAGWAARIRVATALRTE